MLGGRILVTVSQVHHNVCTTFQHHCCLPFYLAFQRLILLLSFLCNTFSVVILVSLIVLLAAVAQMGTHQEQTGIYEKGYKINTIQ